MLTIKNLLDNGICIQERATNITTFSNIEHLEELNPDDIINGDYYPELNETVYSSASYDLWMQYNEESAIISFDDFKNLIKECQNVDDVIDYINKNK